MFTLRPKLDLESPLVVTDLVRSYDYEYRPALRLVFSKRVTHFQVYSFTFWLPELFCWTEIPVPIQISKGLLPIDARTSSTKDITSSNNHYQYHFIWLVYRTLSQLNLGPARSFEDKFHTPACIASNINRHIDQQAEPCHNCFVTIPNG
jgi:hypothetical protein